MKSLFITLAVLFSLSVSSKPLVFNRVSFEYTRFIYDVCDELQIEETIYLVETKLQVHGFVKRIDSGYIVFVNKCSDDKKKIIAHELVHVKQDIDKRWDVNQGTIKLTESGNEYVSKLANEIEKEAENKGWELYKKYGIKRYRNKKWENS